FYDAAQAEVSATEVEAPFQAGIDADIVWIPVRSWLTFDLLVIVDGGEGEAGAPVDCVDKVPVMLEFWQQHGQPTARDDAIGRVPGQRAGLLRAEQRQSGVIVDGRVGARRGTGIGDVERVTIGKQVAGVYLHGVKVVLPAIRK